MTVGISDCVVSADPQGVIATHALGSCIAVAIYDPVAGVSGLLHFMLPDSATDPERARTRPYMFADSGIPTFFRMSYELGAVKQRLKVALIGGAQVLGTNDVFQIGKRNHVAARKILWKAGVMVHHEDVGGEDPRTVHMDVSSGRVVISHGGRERELVPAQERKRNV
ncbi:chemotaxis protein CheD [Terriglobus tenax]|uniref:chemotaxis protein CheD n=1 Tax=Terriglobus tenax TaxID=1111115 RepID=UPI0021E0B4E9|nr:chemotaxis protein CheD [Terriglobus tenax]